MKLINVDSTIHEAAVDAKEAAKILGVKRETLYAYASRGWLRSVASGKGKARHYLREDIERLRARHDARSGHTAVAAGALQWGEPVLDSALTGIDARGPRYRGMVATDLVAKGTTLEAAAELLWTGVLPESAPSWTPASAPKTKRIAALLPNDAPPLVVLSLLVPALGARDPARFGGSRESELTRARGLIARMATWLGGAPEEKSERDNPQPISALALASLGARATSSTIRAMDAALVLLLDHELNISSFAARVTASSGADLYACVTAGIAALSGPKHGGHCDRVEAMVAEARDPERAEDVIAARSRRGETIPGFGHPLYPAGDPRTIPLLASANALAPRNHGVRTINALVDAVAKLRGDLPTVDCGLVALSLALGAPAGSAAGLFALGRASGWVAHALEQRDAGFMLRPRARYVGALRAPTLCANA